MKRFLVGFSKTITLTLVLTLSGTLVGAATTTPPRVVTPAVELPPEPTYADEFEPHRELLDAAVTAAKEKFNSETIGDVRTEKLSELSSKVYEALHVAESPQPHENGIVVPGLLLGEKMNAEFTTEIQETAKERISAVEQAVEAWEAELAAEKERIRKAEEERKRKEAEAAAAARSSAAYIPRPGESQHARVARLMASAGISISFTIGECGIANALGCYTTGSSTILITPRGLSRNDCTVKTTITHEYRHYQQWQQGLIQFGGNGISNRDWLEADARAHSWC